MNTYKKATATGTTTNAIINFLNMIGFLAWRNNTGGVWDGEKKIFRRNKKQLKGVPDILGMDWNGRFIAVEVKRKDDKCSVEQTLFATEFIARNGVFIIAGHIDDVTMSLRYYNYDINDNGYMRTQLPLKDRILNYTYNDHIPNANKLKKLSVEIMASSLSNIATGGMAEQKLKLILGKYSERVML